MVLTRKPARKERAKEPKPGEGGGTLTDKTLNALASSSKQKLPEIPLPSFDGKNHLDYFAFWNTFQNLVDSRADITDSLKLTYLLDVLKGEAHACVTSVMQDEDGYKEAVRLLKKTYGQKEALHDSYLMELVEYPAKSSLSTTELRALLNKFRGIVSTLTKLGTPSADPNVAECVLQSQML